MLNNIMDMIVKKKSIRIPVLTDKCSSYLASWPTINKKVDVAQAVEQLVYQSEGQWIVLRFLLSSLSKNLNPMLPLMYAWMLDKSA